ncbi:unnamed protein product [Arabidopsis lyrata]|uniref:Transcriptional regulator of RNA polII, SAGA, subunit n=1 Tax=Arabidopsis lyrata subsp. lyrata TaxID=81972 RepID=D7MB65_ARALL|nr:uncharacterized protein LOC9303375 [Arabidopsis lyrata subsp. lyrata]EFH45584.1 hypothetical protein ARALYDRAFT_491593 [Arabidopsis lyrata subsp. lyrata]CAH8274712.1 unnamed protein product [Arabidopsis lyrata]|eukprot:XP_002869325.1 uncharacterized protein LOC9303375 [Arabidopsis lyrata subsp. lyrata]
MQRLQDPRVDLADLKVHIVKKIGVERSRRYFYYLGRFLSQKLTKSEFDKSCFRLLGRENLSLHNKLIRSILRNASLAKSPPPGHQTGHPGKSLVLGKEDGPEQSGPLIPDHSRNDPVCSNGVLPNVRFGTCDSTIRDKPCPLGPNGKVDRTGNSNTENRDSGPFAYQRSGRYADERDSAFLCPAEQKRDSGKGQVAAPLSRDDEAQEERGSLILSMPPVVAPLGIPFCSASVGGDRRTVPISTSADAISCYDSGGLSDTEMLRKRMENIAVAQGLGGVSAECSTVLNNMLDLYLKKLMKSCVDLAGARSMNGTPGKQSLDKQQSRDELVNGVRTSNSLHIQTSNQPSDITQEQHSVSLLDFRVAMELNPHQLGEDWPLLRERISICSFEEREGV